MKRKKLTETFMIISILKTRWCPWFVQQYFKVVRVYVYVSSVQRQTAVLGK